MDDPKEDVCYHESAHAVVGKLFEDVCVIESISTNAEYSQQYDSLAIGGLKVIGNAKTLATMNPGKRANKFLLIFLAGFCIDRLRQDGAIPSRLKARQYVQNEYRQAMYSGDKERIDDRFSVLRRYVGHDWPAYLEISIPHLCTLLRTDEVWSMIGVVSEELKSSPSHVLTGEQLEQLFIKHRFSEWVSTQGNLIEAQEREIFLPFLKFD